MYPANWGITAGMLLLAALLPLSLLLLLRGKGVWTLKLALKRFLRSRSLLILSLPVVLLSSVVLSSLSVGDSLVYTVVRNTERNLSSVELIVEVGRPISLKEWMKLDVESLPHVESASPMIYLDGHLPRAIPVRVLGTSRGIENLLPLLPAEGEVFQVPRPGEAYINRELAGREGAAPGDYIDVDLSGFDGVKRSSLQRVEVRHLHLKVAGVIENRGLGRFRRDSRGEAPPIVVLNATFLEDAIEGVGANLLLIDLKGGWEEGNKLKEAMEDIRVELDRRTGLDEVGFSLVRAERAGGVILTSRDFFFGGDSFGRGGIRTLAYFVDSIEGGEGFIPYSIALGVEPLPDGRDVFRDVSGREVHFSLGENDAVINNWTAEALGVEVGDTITLRYRVVGEYGELIERSASFTVSRVISLEGGALETSFFPEVRGLTDVESCSEWEPPFEVNLSFLSERDLQYWEIYRTAPKVYISYERARELWSNLYGDTTGLWYPDGDPGAVARSLNETVTLADVPGRVVDARGEALLSTRALYIFPEMFLTFSVPIILTASITLMVAIREVHIRRSRDLGILKALGFTRRHLTLLSTFESIPSLLLGGFISLPVGYALSAGINRALGGVWSQAVEGEGIELYVSPRSVILSVTAGFLLSLILSILFTWRVVGRTPAANIRRVDPTVSSQIKKTRFILSSCIGFAVAVVLLSLQTSGAGTSLAFILSALLLSFSLSTVIYLLLPAIRVRGAGSMLLLSSIKRRGLRNLSSTVAVASALCLVLSLTAIGASSEKRVEERIETYGGGFDLWVSLSIPFSGDPGVVEGSLGEGAEVRPIYAVGEEGGRCSNINAPYPPRLLGVDPAVMVNSTFHLIRYLNSFSDDREVLRSLGDRIGGRVPILVDENTLTWIYQKSLGDLFVIEDERGVREELLVVGVLPPSVLAGNFITSKKLLEDLFPTLGAYRILLIKLPEGLGVREAESILTSELGVLGPQVQTTKELALEDAEAELTYVNLFRDFLLISLFTATISSASAVHLRAVGSRREIAVLRSLGMSRRMVWRYLATEGNLLYLSAAVSAAVAVLLVHVFLLHTTGSSPLSGAPILPLAVSILALLLLSSLLTLFSVKKAVRTFEIMGWRWVE